MGLSRVKTLARLLAIRRKSGDDPYILILGGGASLESSNPGVIQAVKSISAEFTGVEALAIEDSVTLTEYFRDLLDGRSQTERLSILRRYFNKLTPSVGFRYLAGMVKDGYFDIILTTNFDSLLENALAKLIELSDLLVLVSGKDKEERIVELAGSREPRVKVIKLHGDLKTGSIAFTHHELFQFEKHIEDVLRDFLSRDIVVVGHSMRDVDISKCIERSGGAIWYVNPNPPPIDSFIFRAMRARGSEENVISGEYGEFDRFFQTVSEELARKEPLIVSFGSDVMGWASTETESYLRGIGVDALAIDSCISMYHSFEGLRDGFIKCEFLEEPVSLPPDLRALVDNLSTLEKNNPKCRLVQYAPPLSDARDYLELMFCPTDYHTFLAINTVLDKVKLSGHMTVREKYWRKAFYLPRSSVPNMFYVHLLLISGDNRAIVLQRSRFVEEYKGMWSATLEEQMRPKQAGVDYDKDVFDTATRGVREEIGIEVERKDVTFLSLTFEYPNFNVGLAGVVRTQATAQEIWQAWHLKYEDRETSRFAAIPFEPEVIMPLLKEQDFNPAVVEDRHPNAAPWHPTARFRLVLGLFHIYGVDEVLGTG